MAPIGPNGKVSMPPKEPPEERTAVKSLLSSTPEWCCTGEGRGGKAKGGRRSGACVQSTLADCNGARSEDERQRADLNRMLLLAATTGNKQAIQDLLQKNADINTSRTGKTCLHLAAHSGQEEIVQELVLLKADTNLQDQDLRTPLHVSCLNGSLEMCKVLIEGGESKPNIQDKAHMLPLHFACVGGHYDIVEILLKNGATVEVVEPKVQALHFAALGGHCRIAALLLDFAADVDLQTKRDNESALHLAASRGRNGTVALLLWRNASVDVRNVHQCTPMHLAARRDHIDTVRLLLNARADPFALQKNDWTPMLIAFKEGNVELGRFLQSYTMAKPREGQGGAPNDPLPSDQLNPNQGGLLQQALNANLASDP